ncbi:SGNH/GDSL hydrolase family protein [Mycolicibacterium madagascariense]|nr:SGNH/GDSL hydrolase family protein [Mycolicibacterium madagascariense]
MAAGPGIRPRASGAPLAAGRSAGNYAHLVARQLSHDLVDVTFSGATTANVLTERQHGAPPQVSALTGAEDLVTVTIGGNDVGYVPYLVAAGLPAWVRSVPVVGRAVRGQLDVAARDAALAAVGESLRTVGRELRRRAPTARVLFVDYLTLVPPAGTAEVPFTEEQLHTAQRISDTLEQLTAAAAADTGCELVRAGDAGRAHHPWSDAPWTTRFGLPLPGRPAPLHPNAAGMRAVADLIIGQLA